MTKQPAASTRQDQAGQGKAGHRSDVMAAGEGNLSRIHWHDPSSRQEGPGQPHHLGEEMGTWAGKVPSSVLAELTRVTICGAGNFVSVMSACSNESMHHRW